GEISLTFRSAITTADERELATRQWGGVPVPICRNGAGPGAGPVQPSAFPNADPRSWLRRRAKLCERVRARAIVRLRGSTASSAIVATGGPEVRCVLSDPTSPRNWPRVVRTYRTGGGGSTPGGKILRRK